MGLDRRPRCDWAEGDELLRRYHDEEWGVPEFDDRRLFELMTLEAAQSGLSWRLILSRREGYRRAFAEWDIERVAAFDERDVERLVADAGIVRNRAKIEATVANARAALEATERWSGLHRLLWSFVDDVTVRNGWRSVTEIPSQTERSQAMARDLKRHGFRFLGPTTCYSLMQAAGLVNDHLVTCFRYNEV